MKLNNNFTNRIPSLDGLRAVSIGLVLLSHLSGAENFPITEEVLNIGNVGVRVFFIISGFLITTILLNEVEKSGTVNLAKFFYRRTLRIFPPYYFFLFTVGFLSLYGVFSIQLNEWLAAAFYVSNFAPVSNWEIGHTWSLAVEEQFYLLMPAILLLLGKRRTFFVLCLVVVLCPVIRLGTFMWYQHTDLRWALYGFQANADSLALGCLLAFARERLWNNNLYRKLMYSKLFFILPVAAIGLNYFVERPKIYFFVIIAAVNLCIVLCIDWAVTFYDGFIGKILNARPLVYVGTLSYSIYLWQQLFLKHNSPSPLHSFPINLVLLTVCALASYYLIEKPALSLRQKIEPALFTPLRKPVGSYSGN